MIGSSAVYYDQYELSAAKPHVNDVEDGELRLPNLAAIADAN